MKVPQRKYKLHTDVEPTGIQSVIVVSNERFIFSNLDEGIKCLEAYNYDFISLPLNATSRVQQGKKAFISHTGNLVKEAVIYMPNKRSKLVRKSPILYSNSAKEAIHNMRIQYFRELSATTNIFTVPDNFCPNDEDIERALQDSVDLPLEDISIPTNRFNEEELTVWAFGQGDTKKAQTYGDFLKELNINLMPIWTVNPDYVNQMDKPFVRQLSFEGLEYQESALNGVTFNPWGVYVIRGVLQEAKFPPIKFPRIFLPERDYDPETEESRNLEDYEESLALENILKECLN